MTTRACLLTLWSLLQATTGLAQGVQPDIELTTDRDSYYVGEPVRLTLTVTNTGDAPVVGYMLLQPYLPAALRTSRLLYRREDEAMAEFLGQIPGGEERCMVVVPTQLPPGKRQRSEFVVAVNPMTQQFVLDAPGNYEFRWTTWGIHDRPGASTRARGPELSAVAVIRVLPVPPSERKPFEFYVENKLGELAQLDLAYGVNKEELRLAGKAMRRHYPHSAYADAIQGGLLTSLESVARQGRASAEEQELIAELRARLARR